MCLTASAGACAPPLDAASGRSSLRLPLGGGAHSYRRPLMCTRTTFPNARISSSSSMEASTTWAIHRSCINCSWPTHMTQA